MNEFSGRRRPQPARIFARRSRAGDGDVVIKAKGGGGEDKPWDKRRTSDNGACGSKSVSRAQSRVEIGRRSKTGKPWECWPGCVQTHTIADNSLHLTLRYEYKLKAS